MGGAWPKYETIEITGDDGIMLLTLARPDQLNAFTVEMADELIDAFERASANDDVRAIIVTGKGRAFCAGMDLTRAGNVFGLDTTLRPTMNDMCKRLDEADILHGVRDTGGRVSLAIVACNKPVIAAINGPAVGVGITMTLAMDARIASDAARIGFVFGKLGIVPEACSTYFLPRLVGLSRALEWIYSANLIDLDEAHTAGLLREIVSQERLLDEARALAHRFTDMRSPMATALARRMLYEHSGPCQPLEAHQAESLAMFYTSIDDGREGIAAYREKRAPVFRKKASEAKIALS